GETAVYNLQHTIYQLKPNSNTQRVLHTLEPLQHRLREPGLSASKREQLLKFKQDYCLEIPLVRGVEAIGLVELFRTQDQYDFDHTDIQFAQTIASQIANALYNATIASESRARVAQLSMLNRISNILSLAPTLKDVFEGARREIMSLVEATGMSIILLTPDEKALQWVYGFEYGEEVDLTNLSLLNIDTGFSGYVVRNREVLHINRRIAELHQELQSITVGAFPSSWLGLPLIVANKLIGVLAVENEHDTDAFLERDIELLQTISGPLAIAINNLIQFEEVQAALAAQSEQRLQLQTAAEVAAATTSILNQQELMEQAVTLIKERFDLYYVGLFLIDQDAQTAVLRAGTGEAGRLQIENGHRLPVGGHSLIGGVTNDGKNRITQDVSQDKEWHPNPMLPNTKSELALPLKVRGQIIGAVTVQSEQPQAFNQELIGTLQTMSDQLAIAIENAELLASSEAKARQQQRLNEISTKLYRSGDVSEIIRTGLQAISEELDGTAVALRLGILHNNGQQEAVKK
ncbi:MAG: GAF domain-containing protein, partial [Anaerolineales bacterium]|nr:GAF domain-containing protein [Anaerolineales bacterium]